jgi:D-inositol-3-phosphate glycosyltransferase
MSKARRMSLTGSAFQSPRARSGLSPRGAQLSGASVALRARLRILFASHYALPHLGGIEVAVDQLARELVRRGHEVTHLASASVRPNERLEADPPYRVERVEALNGLAHRLHVPYPLFSPRLLSVARREAAAADVVHAHGFLYMTGLAALALGKRQARVLTEHVGRVGYGSRLLDAAERAAIATLGRAGVRRADAVIVLNDKVRDEIRAFAPGVRVERIFNGVDSDRYRPAGKEERARLRRELGWDERPRALFVGRLVSKKGVKLAVEAARRAGVAISVVGPGEPGFELGAYVELLGPQPQGRVAELYRAADAFLLPSRGEGFPVTAQEAMASGLPVLLSDDASYGPYLEGAGAGARMAPPNPEALASALLDLLAEPGASEAAVSHARRAFSWARAADAHERLYSELLAGRRA